MREFDRAPSRLAWALALSATPLVVLASTASDLYLRNQDELGHDIGLLTPFFVLSLGSVIASSLLVPFRRYRSVRLVLWAHFLAAPWFLCFHLLQAWSLGSFLFRWFLALPIGTALLGMAYAGSTFLMERSKRPHLQSIVVPVAAFSALLLVMEALELAPALAAPSEQEQEIQLPAAEASVRRPNIYHLVLDGYQTDFFEMTLSDSVREDLDGFVYYPNALALYGDTKSSVPSFLTGKMQPEGMSSDDFLLHGLGSRDSFLYWLKQAGYVTLAYLPPLYRVETPWIDVRVFHSENGRGPEVRALNRDTFRRLWAYANLPRPVTETLLGSSWFVVNEGDDLAQIESDRFLPRSAPVRSYFSFLNALEQEASLPEANRYTLNHLLIPHVPEVLYADCRFDPARPDSGPLPQAQCATEMIQRFVRRLKGLNRYDNALILIHADHGEFYRIDGEAIHAASEISLRALTLVKPPNRRAPFTVSDREVTLMSLAPTILDIVDVADRPVYASPSLLDLPATSEIAVARP